MANDKDFRVKNGLYVATDASILGNTVIGNQLSANGNVNFTNSPNVALGTVGNVVITGGTNGQYLQTNGSGGLTWATVSAGSGASISNGTSNVNIPASGGNVNTSVAGNANVLIVTGTGINTGNAIINNDLYVGNGAATTSFTNPIAIFKDSGLTYVQVSVINSSGNGSADLITYGNNGDDNQSWTDIGFTGNTFNDANYTVTAPGDGYLFVQGNSSFGGNLVIATGNLGTTKDIIFATGGFLTGNIKARLFNANGAFSVTGNVIGGNLTTAGALSVTGNANVGNLGTAQVLATANITAPQLISNVATGTAPLVVTSTTQVANLSVATAGSATTAGTVTTNAQPNITSVGILTGLTTSGTLNVAQGASTSVVYIYGGGTANNGTVFGRVQFGDQSQTNKAVIRVSSANAGNSQMDFQALASSVFNTTLSLTGTGANITGTANISGNANVGNLGTTGLITATGNVSGANIVSSAYSIVSVGTAISAAGTVQANATALTKEFNVVSTVTAGSGVSLPTAVAGMRITVLNTSANALLVYPATNGIINSAAANAAYSQPAGARLDYISTTATQWYTLNATYG